MLDTGPFPILHHFVYTTYRDEVAHLPLLFRIGDLREQRGLVFGRVSADDPLLRLVVHLPGPGRDRVRGLGHPVVRRVEEGDQVLLVCLGLPLGRTGELYEVDRLFLRLDGIVLLPVLPDGDDGRDDGGDHLQDVDDVRFHVHLFPNERVRALP